MMEDVYRALCFQVRMFSVCNNFVTYSVVVLHHARVFSLSQRTTLITLLHLNFIDSSCNLPKTQHLSSQVASMKCSLV